MAVVTCGEILFGCSSATSQKSSENNKPTSPQRIAGQAQTQSKVEKRIQEAIKDSVPIGSSSERVVSWLKSQAMEIQRVKKASFAREDFQSLIRQNGYQPSDLEQIIVSFKKQKVGDSEFYAAVIFFFDIKGQLSSIYVSSFGTSQMKRTEGKPTLSEVHNILNKEFLNEMSKTEIQQWLSRKRWSYRYLDSKKYDLGDESLVNGSKYKPSDLSGVIRVVIPDIAHSDVATLNIIGMFFFDKEGRLLSYTFIESGTGL